MTQLSTEYRRILNLAPAQQAQVIEAFERYILQPSTLTSLTRMPANSSRLPVRPPHPPAGPSPARSSNRTASRSALTT